MSGSSLHPLLPSVIFMSSDGQVSSYLVSIHHIGVIFEISARSDVRLEAFASSSGSHSANQQSIIYASSTSLYHIRRFYCYTGSLSSFCDASHTLLRNLTTSSLYNFLMHSPFITCSISLRTAPSRIKEGTNEEMQHILYITTWRAM